MGMAASQARFLGLTARKNNVEFEGQQVNQQRTALSNQSANYYNDLLGMSVPIPPSVDDYTKTVYTFEDGALTNQITTMIAQKDGYTISYLRQWTDDFAVVSASTSIVNRQGTKPNYEYFVGSNKLALMKTYDISGKTADSDDGKEAIAAFKDERGGEAYIDSLSDDQIFNLIKEENELLANCRKELGEDEYYVRYVKNSATGEYNPYFYRKKDLETSTYDDVKTGNSLSNISCFKIGSKTRSEEIKAQQGCLVEKDSSGRYISLSIPIPKENEKDEQQYTNYALTTSTVTDQAKYEDAMNQYEYEKYEYDQAIQEINSKIEIVQAEDKNLELRLKQLDTEQKAISTEIESVSQVIQKNVESSFKTFG